MMRKSSNFCYKFVGTNGKTVLTETTKKMAIEAIFSSESL